MKILELLLVSFFAFGYAYLNEKGLAGSWILIDKTMVNYPEIIFEEQGTALFKSKGDTLYRYHYQLKADSTIELTDVRGQKYDVKIVKLSEDSLIFQRLTDQKEVQVYLRKRL